MRHRVLARLEVREDVRARQDVADLPLDLLGQVMPALHRPRAGDEHVHLDEVARPGLPRAYGVELDAPRLVALEHLGDETPLVQRNGGVEQAAGGAPHELDAGPDDVQRYGDGDERIERTPAGERNEADAHYHARR